MNLIFFIIILFVCQTFQHHVSQKEFEIASLDHSKFIPNIPQNIAFLTLEEQAKWADPITKKYATDHEFSLRNLYGFPIISDEKNYERGCSELNRTSIANLAYMVLHSPMKTGYQSIYDESLKMFQSCKWEEHQ